MNTDKVAQPQKHVMVIHRSGPDFPADGAAAHPMALRNTRLRALAEELAGVLYRIDRAWAGSTQVDVFAMLAARDQAPFRAKAEQIVALLDTWCASRAASRAIEWAAISNDLNGDDWSDTVRDLARQMASDAMAAFPSELSRMWREDVGGGR